MIQENIVNIVSFGLTSMIAIIVSNFFFKNVPGGIKIPLISGNLYVKKSVGFLFFFISLYFVGYLSTFIFNKLNEFLIENLLLGLIISVPLLYLIFNFLFYKKS